MSLGRQLSIEEFRKLTQDRLLNFRSLDGNNQSALVLTRGTAHGDYILVTVFEIDENSGRGMEKGKEIQAKYTQLFW